MIRNCLSAFALTLALGAGPALAVTGSYTVSGTGMDGVGYNGTAQIDAPEGGGCSVSWQVLGSEFAGTCLRADDALAVLYTQVGGDQTGLILYQIHADGTLHGVWTVTGTDGQGTEVLTPVSTPVPTPTK